MSLIRFSTDWLSDAERFGKVRELAERIAKLIPHDKQCDEEHGAMLVFACAIVLQATLGAIEHSEFPTPSSCELATAIVDLVGHTLVTEPLAVH